MFHFSFPNYSHIRIFCYGGKIKETGAGSIRMNGDAKRVGGIAQRPARGG